MTSQRRTAKRMEEALRRDEEFKTRVVRDPKMVTDMQKYFKIKEGIMELEVHAKQLSETTVLNISVRKAHIDIRQHVTGLTQIDLFDLSGEEMIALGRQIILEASGITDKDEELPLDGQQPYENCYCYSLAKRRCVIGDESKCRREIGLDCRLYNPVCRVCSEPLGNPDHEVCCAKCVKAENL